MNRFDFLSPNGNLNNAMHYPITNVVFSAYGFNMWGVSALDVMYVGVRKDEYIFFRIGTMEMWTAGESGYEPMEGVPQICDTLGKFHEFYENSTAKEIAEPCLQKLFNTMYYKGNLAMVVEFLHRYDIRDMMRLGYPKKSDAGSR